MIISAGILLYEQCMLIVAEYRFSLENAAKENEYLK